MTPAASTPKDAEAEQAKDDELDISADAVHVAFTIRQNSTDCLPLPGKTLDDSDEDDDEDDENVMTRKCIDDDDDSTMLPDHDELLPSFVQFILDYYGTVTIRVVPLALTTVGVMLVTSLATYAGVCGLSRRSLSNGSSGPQNPHLAAVPPTAGLV